MTHHWSESPKPPYFRPFLVAGIIDALVVIGCWIGAFLVSGDPYRYVTMAGIVLALMAIVGLVAGLVILIVTLVFSRPRWRTSGAVTVLLLCSLFSPLVIASPPWVSKLYDAPDRAGVIVAAETREDHTFALSLAGGATMIVRQDGGWETPASGASSAIGRAGSSNSGTPPVVGNLLLSGSHPAPWFIVAEAYDGWLVRSLPCYLIYDEMTETAGWFDLDQGIRLWKAADFLDSGTKLGDNKDAELCLNERGEVRYVAWPTHLTMPTSQAATPAIVSILTQ